jgi:hypothetical protein
VSSTAPFSPLAAALARAVAGHRNTRVPLDVLHRAAQSADLSLRGAPDGRQRLAEAIEELAGAGIVTTPRGSAGWDQLPRPPLPRWVARLATSKPIAAAEPPVSWHATLSWVPAFLIGERPSAGEAALLRAVNAFLGRGGSALDVPVRERSLQLTGDEKALDTLSRGRLFAPRRLSLDLLAAYRTSPPLTRHRIGSGQVTLLVENWATCHSLTKTLPSDGNVGSVVYGAGNTLGTVLTALADEPPLPLVYFGDLDVRGLEIAGAGYRFAANLGLPALRPAGTLYQLLLEHGYPAVVDQAPTRERVRRGLGWLPAPLRPAAGQILDGGHRLAQEAVGLELLKATPPDILRAVGSEAT